MSYDLYMLAAVPGEEPMDTVERLEEQEDAAPPAPAAAARIRRMADALKANASYIEGDEAEPGCVELSDEDGLHITLSGEHAAFNFPYWDSLDAKRLSEEIARAAKVIGGETGWDLYDPQLERFVDPVADAEEFAAAFSVGVGHVQRIVAEGSRDGGTGDRPSLLRRIFRR